MKKFAILLSLAVVFSVTTMQKAKAQNNLKPLISNAQHAAGLDTVTNAATVNQSGTISGYNSIVTIQTVYTKQSGTVAAVARLYGSLDNVNFARIKNDSLLISNVTPAQTKVWDVAPSSCTYYRVITTGTTGVGTVKSIAIWRTNKQ